MKIKSAILVGLIMLVAAVFNDAFSQTDTTLVAPPDTVVQISSTDTTLVAQPNTEVQESSKEVKKKDGKRRDEFIVYAGVNYSQLGLSSDTYESGSKLGFDLGFSYRRGKFLYWQAGALFNNSVYGYSDNNTTDKSTSLTVKSIDIPLTGGINVLSFVNRVVGLRIFASAVPAFVIGVNDNPFDIQKDDVNSFLFYGQAGIGGNIAFFIVDVGYNFGFQDLITNQTSKPEQLFINLGFRF